MTNKQIPTTWNGKNSSVPLLFSDNLFNSFFDQITPAKMYPSDTVYPYNVEDYEDEKGHLLKTAITFALAGVPKSAINIDVSDNILSIEVKDAQTSREAPKGRWILKHKGIGQRQSKISFSLHDADEENITSSFKDGMLEIVVPVIKHKKHSIKIN